LALLVLGVAVPLAQTSPVFRIGLLANSGSPLAQGAQLAVQEINASGGVRGADGTLFQLQLVQQSPDDLEFAVANINQASVIAVIGPAGSDTVLENRDLLAQLDVPILTPATDDAIITNDTTDLLLRLRAQEILQGRALANYLINDLSAASLVTVQLDVASTVSVLSFTRAARQQGLDPSFSYVLADDVTLADITGDILQNAPQFVVAYGDPATMAPLYNDLRAVGWSGRFIYEQAAQTDFRQRVPDANLSGIIAVDTWSYTYDDETSQAFVLAYLGAFGDVPTSLSAAAYDGVYLLREAIGNAGNLVTNLFSIRDFDGVQGELSPATLVPGEISNNVSVLEMGEFGAPIAVARYAGIQRLQIAQSGGSTFGQPTPIPSPTLVPTATQPVGPFLEVTRTVQNVRTGPGLNYDILGQLPEGSTADIIGATIDFSWVAIEFRGTTGWLSRPILDVNGDRNQIRVLTPPPSPTPPPATATPTAQPIPDVVVTNAIPNRITIGVPFNVTATIANRGGSPARQFAVAASFEPGNVYNAVILNSLAAGTQTNITFTGTLTGPTGPQDVTIVADLNNQVPESTTGEANNDDFILNYIADAPLLTTAQATGQITLSETGVTALDGGMEDVQWGGGGLVALGSTELVRLTNFTSFNNVHRDAIASAPLANQIITPVTNGMLIGIRTDGGLKYGVIEVVNAVAGSQLTFNYRMYEN